MMDAKSLKKLAAACRKAGIKKYQCPEFSFELTDEAPLPPINSKAYAQATSSDDVVATDSLSEEALLFYSVMDREAG